MALAGAPDYEKAKFYYDNQQARIERSPVGNDHSSDHAVLAHAILTYASLAGIAANGKDCLSYRQTGVREVQPDLSYYVGEAADAIPYGTGMVNLDEFPPPNLAIEIANTSFADDLGKKRLLYEELGVQEYWVVNVQEVKIYALAIADRGSRQIRESQVLPGLTMSLLEEVLRRSRASNHSEATRWLYATLQAQLTSPRPSATLQELP